MAKEKEKRKLFFSFPLPRLPLRCVSCSSICRVFTIAFMEDEVKGRAERLSTQFDIYSQYSEYFQYSGYNISLFSFWPSFLPTPTPAKKTLQIGKTFYDLQTLSVSHFFPSLSCSLFYCPDNKNITNQNDLDVRLVEFRIIRIEKTNPNWN